MILQACPDIAEYRPSGETPRNWRHFIEATRLLRPMSGISRDAWSAATTAVGEKSLATALAAILQRFEHSSEARMVLSSTDGANSCEVNGSPAIKSPSAYLRDLTLKQGLASFPSARFRWNCWDTAQGETPGCVNAVAWHAAPQSRKFAPAPKPSFAA